MSDDKPIDHDRPSPETLAGFYICMEGTEEILVQLPPEQRKKTHAPETRTVAGLTINMQGDEVILVIKPEPPESKKS
jgi:hypothetical protein